MSERCCKTWRKEWITKQCSRNGKVERDGKWYCTQHDPVEVKKRRDKSYRELCAKLDSEEAQRKFEKSAIAACTGMTDPAAEIAAKDAEIARLRHELADAIDVANALRTALNDHDNAENFRALHDEAQEEIAKLRADNDRLKRCHKMMPDLLLTTLKTGARCGERWTLDEAEVQMRAVWSTLDESDFSMSIREAVNSARAALEGEQ